MTTIFRNSFRLFMIPRCKESSIRKLCFLNSIKTFCLAASVLITTSLHSQADSTSSESPSLNILGFLDIFYAYDFDRPNRSFRQPFLFNHNRHNEINLNVGMITMSVDHSKYRGNISLQTGTYGIDNYVAEPGLLQNIYEANIGVSLNKKGSLWLDAGILPSHIGFESAISIDNMTLTRSILAESSPFFSTGARLTYTPNDRWECSGWLMNGWQRIQRVEGNSLISLGTQVLFHPNSSVTLNWSTFIGTDDADETRRMRYFNNFYAHVEVSQIFRFVAGFDYGSQQVSKGSSDYDHWLSPIIIGQFTHNDHWNSAIRVEYFSDPSGVVIPLANEMGFQTFGFSYNVDYSPVDEYAFRMEGRWLKSREDVLESNSGFDSSNFTIAMSLAIKFGKSL